MSEMAPFIVGACIIFAALLIIRFRRRTVIICYRQKDTYCDVWSPQLPGASAVGQHLAPALINYLRQHGERLGVRLKEDP